MGGTFPNVDEPNYPPPPPHSLFVRHETLCLLPFLDATAASLLSLLIHTYTHFIALRPSVRRSWVHFTLPMPPRTLESVCARACARICILRVCSLRARSGRSLTFVFCMRKCVCVCPFVRREIFHCSVQKNNNKKKIIICIYAPRRYRPHSYVCVCVCVCKASG